MMVLKNTWAKLKVFFDNCRWRDCEVKLFHYAYFDMNQVNTDNDCIHIKHHDKVFMPEAFSL